jgi:hypothetical protein
MPKETQNLGQKFNQPDKGFRLDDIFEVEKIFKEAEKEEQDLEEDTLDEEDTCEDESERLSNALIEKIERGGNIQEALREVIHSSVKNSYAIKELFHRKILPRMTDLRLLNRSGRNYTLS